MRKPLVQQRAEHHEHHCHEQDNGQQPLFLRLFAGNERGDKDTACQERRSSPEEGELHVPCSGDGVGDKLPHINPEEACELHTVVLGKSTHKSLQQEQHQNSNEEQPGRLLRGGQAHLVGLAEVQHGCLLTMPADGAGPAAIDGEH